jgi:hypothetical protein
MTYVRHRREYVGSYKTLVIIYLFIYLNSDSLSIRKWY